MQIAGFFSGTGGIEIGFRAAGFDIAYACERDQFARQSYAAYFGHAPEGADIRDVQPEDVPAVDGIVGGFPCTPFSRAGQNSHAHYGLPSGFAHESGNAFFELARIVEGMAERPRFLLLENVRNLLHHDGGHTWAVIRGTLEALGYTVHARVLDAACLVPQHRERTYIVCLLGHDVPFAWPVLPDLHPKLADILDAPEDVPASCTLKDATWACLQRHAAKHQAQGNNYRFSIADPSGISRTITARYYKDGAECLIAQDGKNPRKLSVKETFRLQGFPEDYPQVVSNLQAYKQAGNAVVVPMIYFLARAIAAHFAAQEQGEDQDAA